MQRQISGRPALVIDKSFLQAQCACLEKLSTQYAFIITSGFYFEVFHPLNNSSRAVLSRIGEFRRVNTPNLLRFERENGTPATVTDLATLTVNPQIVSGERSLTESEEALNTGYENSFVTPQIHFWKDVTRNGVIGFEDAHWPSVRKNPLKNLIPYFERLLNEDFLRGIARDLNFPHSQRLTGDWFYFRFLQTRLMHALYLYACYPAQNNPRKEVDFEHDIHDLDYLSLGVFLQSFATAESQLDPRKLGWRFKYLCPHGDLLSHAGCQKAKNEPITRPTPPT